MLEIQALAARVQDITEKLDFWNKSMLWSLVAAAVAAVFVVTTTRLTIVRGKQLSLVQNSLDNAKSDRPANDLKNKDLEIGKANKAANEANQRAASEALRLREQLAAPGPREVLLRGKNRQKLVDALKPFTGQRIDLRHSSSLIQVNGAVVMSAPIGDDTLGLAIASTGVIKDAGWESPSTPLLTSIAGQGIEILIVHGASVETEKAASALVHDLQEVPFASVRGPLVVDENRAERIGKDVVLPKFDKDTVVMEILSHP